jgi:hypothetical protein
MLFILEDSVLLKNYAGNADTYTRMDINAAAARDMKKKFKMESRLIFKMKRSRLPYTRQNATQSRCRKRDRLDLGSRQNIEMNRQQNKYPFAILVPYEKKRRYTEPSMSQMYAGFIIMPRDMDLMKRADPSRLATEIPRAITTLNILTIIGQKRCIQKCPTLRMFQFMKRIQNR